MASMFKSRTVTYRDAEGKRCRKGEPGAEPVTVVSKAWYGRFKDADGRTVTKVLCADKSAAKMMLAKLATDARLVQVGLDDERKADHRGRTIEAHLEDYRRHLLGHARTPRHVKQTCDRVKAVVDGCGFARVADLDAASVVDYLDGRRKGGMATETSNHYLRAVKAFSAWLQREERSRKDPLRFLSRLNADADRRRKRRSLTDALFASLIAAALASPRVVCGLTGPDRAMLYAVAAGTGLRARELASLTPESLDLGGESVVAEAGYSKRRRRDELPLHSDLARQLRTWISGRPPCSPLWPGRWAEDRHGAEMLRADLDSAKIPYVDAAGRVFDFHALRGQFASSLARAGVHPKGAQQLMWHSDINLTINAYTHLDMNDLKADVERLPPPPRAVAGEEAPDRGSRA